MAISLQELRKAEEKQCQQEEQQQGTSSNPSAWQNEPPEPKGILKFARYLYGN
jgi:hypothetical protein